MCEGGGADDDDLFVLFRRSNIRTPRELLDLGNENDGSSSNQFTRGVWPLRQRIALVAELVLKIEDLNQLIKAKAAALPSEDTLQAPEWFGVRDDLKRLEDSQIDLCKKVRRSSGSRFARERGRGRGK